MSLSFIRTRAAAFLRPSGWFVLWILLATTAAAKSPFYEPGDWVSYTNLSYVTSIAGDDETVYIGTTGGVARYDRYNGEWRTPLTVSDGLVDNRVERVVTDPNTGDVWFKTEVGCSVLWPTSDTWREAPALPDALAPEKSRLSPLPNLFMPFGYMFFPEGYILDAEQRRYPITDYWADPWANLWVGTWGLGIGRADLRTRRLEMFPMGLRQQNVTAIAISGNRLWFGGTDGGGITLYDRGAQLWRQFEAVLIRGLKSDRVRAIFPSDRHVWFGTSWGLSRYDLKKDSWLTYTVFDTLQADEITALEEDGKHLWIGTVSGVSRLNRITGEKEILDAEPLKFRHVNDIAVEPDFVWVATETGLFLYDKATGLWDRFGGDESWLVREVRAVSNLGTEMWFASSLGVIRLDTTTGHLERYPALIFLGNSQPDCLVATREAVWVGTAQGAWQFDRRRETWLHLGQQDGLIDNRVQALAVDGDYVWFGTPRGATRFFWNSPRRLD